ncbi:hypothetical protein SAMN02745163_02701 [Clostridium cavendishii DSM 21758]|uniref:Uncharacterized protein n=1 Tax=Clostridium cavendishii DSM 21758 TaxID=1121302 RepID=A0A1M6MN92_9CLOT|nr:hypothetical protein [Clostridium cavendishii]SHJ84909.1 hypothetical protein SAMN02745163_02701 [Clostridium cavendishii DSM 21758]
MKKLFIVVVLIIVNLTAFNLQGCKNREIKVSDNVKEETKKIEELKKTKTEVVLDKEAKILENLIVVTYKDDEHIIAFEGIKNGKKFYNINLKENKKEELKFDIEIIAVLGSEENGTIIVTDGEYIYSIDKDTFKVEKLLQNEKSLDIDKIREEAICTQQLISKGYIGYFNKFIENSGGLSTYEIINLKTGKKYEIKRYNERFFYNILISEPYVYYRSSNTVNRLNLNTGEIKTVKNIRNPGLINVLNDDCIAINTVAKQGEVCGLFKLDFSNDNLTKFEEINQKLDSNSYFSVESIDVKNNLVYYTERSEDVGKESFNRSLLVGILNGDKIDIKNKIFKNNECEKMEMFKVINNLKNQNKAIVTLILKQDISSYVNGGFVPTKNYIVK